MDDAFLKKIYSYRKYFPSSQFTDVCDVCGLVVGYKVCVSLRVIDHRSGRDNMGLHRIKSQKVHPIKEMEPRQFKQNTKHTLIKT
ncbi:hypothetical protein XELAEV_18012487mg [Xenopus laevis]|uniref:Uncharacterized protein n=1 Tax=Xenopus laevis TaxID=8355 RepID=A0A974DQF3_XENLA|nr:hypothetical protein XELAEV_18012487mg [Xenopus laevis]